MIADRMLRQARSKLTYANVMSTLAVFIAIGGGAYAAGLARDSVKSKQIKANAVKSIEIADGQVAAVDIGDGAVGSSEIGIGAVGSSEIGDGQVGAAEIGDGSVGAAAVSEGLRLECPAGTQYVAGSCPELNLRSPGAQWINAVTTCANAGLRLPSPQELQQLQSEPGFQRATVEWTGNPDGRDADDAESLDALAVTSAGPGPGVATDPVTDSHAFRCVAPTKR